MIYISSACSKQQYINHSVKEIAKMGFKNIELSGGTQYYPGYVKDLLELQKEYQLNFLVHNYFPPPKTPFILNLASLDQAVYKASMANLRKALDLTRLFGGKKFGFHAGFFVDRPVSEIGKKFGKSCLYDTQAAVDNFVKGFELLQSDYSDIDFYLENNCYSASNHKVYGNEIPFMLLSFQDYRQLRLKINFNLLLDIGHLMVNAATLDLDFNEEFQKMFNASDYIHISSNDSTHDQNLGLMGENKLIQMLSGCDWKNKTITLEIYDGLNALAESYLILLSFDKGNR